MEAVAGLDIGSTRVVAAVAVPSKNHTREWKNSKGATAGPVVRDYQVESVGTLGMRKGQITDPDALSSSIKDALTRAEAVSGSKIGTVCLGIPGHTVEYCRKRYSHLIGKRRINQQDIDRINRLAVVSDLPPGRRIIQALPLEYMVDGAPADGLPLGMHGSRLEVEFVLITADSLLIDQLLDVVHRTSVKVGDILPSALASGAVLVSPAQQKLGTVLVDFGGTCTCLLVYNHGKPVAWEVIPVGGDHITSDLAICLRTDLAGAEKVKQSVGLSDESNGNMEGKNDKSSTVIVPRLSGAGFNEVPIKAAVEIIKARVCEIMELVGHSVSQMEGMDLPGGLVLAGGGSQLKGLSLLASSQLGVSVRMGTLGTEEGDSQNAVDVAGAVGLLKVLLDRYHHTEVDDGPPFDLWGKIRGIFAISR